MLTVNYISTDNPIRAIETVCQSCNCPTRCWNTDMVHLCENCTERKRRQEREMAWHNASQAALTSCPLKTSTTVRRRTRSMNNPRGRVVQRWAEANRDGEVRVKVRVEWENVQQYARMGGGGSTSTLWASSLEIVD